jgi:hypothetical protein
VLLVSSQVMGRPGIGHCLELHRLRGRRRRRLILLLLLRLVHHQSPQRASRRRQINIFVELYSNAIGTIFSGHSPVLRYSAIDVEA